MIADQKTINSAVEYIIDKLSPEKIYLFGSYAKGSPSGDSDLDFLIIKKTNLPKHRRALPLYELGKTARIGLPIGVDFIVYTPEEFKQKESDRNSLAGEVLRTGKVVYAKTAE